MTQIDQDIIQEISRYEEGEMDEAEREALAGKIAGDENYQRHLDYYHTIVHAIRRATLARNMVQMQREVPPPDIEKTIDSILARDRRIVWWRRFGIQAALLIAVAVAAFWLGRFTDRQEPQPEPPIVNEEVPIAAPGTAKIMMVPYESQKLLLVETHDSQGIEYSLKDGNLTLFVLKELGQDLLNASPKWRALIVDGIQRDYLKLDDTYYELEPGSERQPLKPITDEAILNQLE